MPAPPGPIVYAEPQRLGIYVEREHPLLESAIVFFFHREDECDHHHYRLVKKMMNSEFP
jgi:hypothetical protein